MSSVISGYSNYSFLTEEQRAAGRAHLERQKALSGEMSQGKKTDADAVDFSTRSRNLAASGSLSQEEMEAFSYSHLLQFETKDGRSISVDLAMDPDSEENYLAARITVTNADGSEEVLYVPFNAPPPPPPASVEEEEETDIAVAEEDETDAQAAVKAAAEEAQPSLLELIEKYGLNKVADASESVFAAIQARIEAMIEASKETAEDEEALEKVRADREERNAASENSAAAGNAGAGGAASGDTGIGQEINAVSGKTARSLAGYARTSAAFTAGMGSFSRRY